MDTSSNLTDPLLTNDHHAATNNVEWPHAEAARAKLYIPSDFGMGVAGSEPDKCMIRYDADKKVLVVVAEESPDVIIDMINPNDIVGAAVEIKLLGSADELRSTKAAFRNTHPTDGDDDGARHDEQVAEAKSSPCDIFQPLVENAENIFSASNNEPLSEIPFDTQAAAVLTIYVYPRRDLTQQGLFYDWCGLAHHRPPVTLTTVTEPSKLGHRYACHRRFEVAPAEDFSAVSTLVRAIRKLACVPTMDRQRKLLIVVNPRSGPKKNGAQVCETIVSPLLEQAGIEHDVLITSHARHAEQRVQVQQQQSDDLSEFDGIVAIGGDGIVHEILQGIRARPDAKDLLKRLKLGVIGTGTANGLAMSIAFASKVWLVGMNE